MHEVSKAINILDPNKTIDGKICKNAYKHTGSSKQGTEQDDMCGKQLHSSSQASNTKTGLSNLWDSTNNSSNAFGGGYDKASSEHVGEKTSAKISKDITELTRDEKGKMSSAFAKAHEGAEIVEIRSISTTSVMVNACYDVLAEGLPVSPYGCAVYTEW